MRTKTDSLATPVLSLAAPIAAPLTRAQFAAPKLVGATLLELMQAFDGKKDARYHVALDALDAAYTQCLTHGDKRQLNAMLAAEGKGKCVTAMRNAIRMTGVMGLHKEGDTLADTIASAVAMASTLFYDAVLAVKPKTVKAPKAAPVAEAASEGEGAQDDDAPAAATPATTIDNAVVMAYAATLDDTALSALLDGLASIVATRANVRMPMLAA